MVRDPRIQRLIDLAAGVVSAPPGHRRISLAIAYGVTCHLIFATAIASMVYCMFFGLTSGLGQVPYPLAIVVNLLLIIQFPLLHSLLLTKHGMRLLAKFAPVQHGRTLGTTTYAIVASLQLLVLFWLWTPSGIIWWQAEGLVLTTICIAYAGSWILLVKAIFDAGIELQSGALGWLSLWAGKAPKFPDMPTLGLFRIIRQPIYFAFALTLWTIPVWTPDQFALAILWTLYCICAPVFKERRYQSLYKARFARYRDRVPYMIPRFNREQSHDLNSTK